MVKYGGRLTGMSLSSIEFWRENNTSGNNFRKDKDCRKDCRCMKKRNCAFWLKKSTMRKKFSLIKELGIW